MLLCDVFHEKSVTFKMSKRKHTFGDTLKQRISMPCAHLLFNLSFLMEHAAISGTILRPTNTKAAIQAASSSAKPAFISHQSSVGENELHWRPQMELSHTATLSIARPSTLATLYRN
jgi:hypothetical protein